MSLFLIFRPDSEIELSHSLSFLFLAIKAIKSKLLILALKAFYNLTQIFLFSASSVFHLPHFLLLLPHSKVHTLNTIVTQHHWPLLGMVMLFHVSIHF